MDYYIDLGTILAYIFAAAWFTYTVNECILAAMSAYDEHMDKW